jgi:type III restriction enzyme
MELKGYQKRVLNCLVNYAREVTRKGTGAAAYDAYYKAEGRKPGDGVVRRYVADLGDVPKVCIKVPTGGGKTLIAANALHRLVDNLPKAPTKCVVWLVPRKEILRQTLRQLRDPGSALRLVIDRDFSHDVEVLDKADGLAARSLNVASVQDQLSLFVLSYDSFKNRDGRLAYQENSALVPLTDYQKSTGQAVQVQGADDTALITALAGMNPIVVVDESHHAKSDLSVEMLRNLNPRFVLELTATPSAKSNVIARATAMELKSENMVKLPVVVYRRDKKIDVVQDAILLQRRLELVAEKERENGGNYIRPIVLFQAERRGTDDAETYRRLRRKLVEAGIAEETIAIRTGDVDELKETDLMSPQCPIRYIITVEALSEGWDCPFAYVLATVANKQSKTNVEQIVGRVLRQPYATRAKARALNISYVLTSSADFNATIDQVVAGLNEAGFSKKDVIPKDTMGSNGKAMPLQRSIEELADETSPEKDDDDLDGLSFAPVDKLAVPEGADATEGEDEERITRMLEDSEAAEEQFTQQAGQNGEYELDAEATGMGEDIMRYAIRDAVDESVKDLLLPCFRLHQSQAANNLFAGLFDTDDETDLDQSALLETFHASRCSRVGMNFDSKSIMDAKQIDVNDEKVLATDINSDLETITRALFQKDTTENKRKTVAKGLLEATRNQARKNYGDNELRRLIKDIVTDMEPATLDSAFDNYIPYARIISDQVDLQAMEYKRDEFDKMRSIGEIKLAPRYRFPDSFTTASPLESLGRTLYEAEDGGMNGLERNVADMLANCGNILWWHRVVERRKGEFYINGFINHYPDFLAMTKAGKILAIETKGEMLKNDDSRDKLALGNTWANAAGDGYRYFMVFANDPLDETGAYSLAEFKTDILGRIS